MSMDIRSVSIREMRFSRQYPLQSVFLYRNHRHFISRTREGGGEGKNLFALEIISIMEESAALRGEIKCRHDESNVQRRNVITSLKIVIRIIIPNT